ncbi:hypothetical protein Agub_g2979 [Astrephomene gubernaculifera]|uniref:Uncharacterized protein n=1 Tax=Astrephomene gubernaculifera TaxID=47775 RepID=A0AAD3DIF8_9CHLO|nr:hypothetical protein Agub_g2979 [Astrephomene gubernaculifera]
MEQLLLPPEGGLRREPSGAFFVPSWTRSTCSGDVTTDTSSTSIGEAEEQQNNSRRISLCKQVLLEATLNFNTAPSAQMPVLKTPACRNSGALLPLLNMLAAEQEPTRTVRSLHTLSFLLLDKANRRVCHELRALDTLLDILRRATDQQVLISALEAICCLCKNDAKDKMSLWQHPNKGALLSMLSNRHSSVIVTEALVTCRALCFAPSGTSSSGTALVSPVGSFTGSCGFPGCKEQQPSDHGSAGGASSSGLASSTARCPSMQLLEPALLTVASELLHPSTDTHVLLRALKLLLSASAIVSSAAGGSSSQGSFWHNAVFRMVPLLTHCCEVDVVEAALAVLVNLSEHRVFHNMFYAAGCIPPLLHLLSHKRSDVSQSASCVLSALSEGGLSRDKLCQDTALLAMLRVLQANHSVVVTLGVLYMLGRLAAYRAQVVRSLKAWGAVQLLTRLLATTRDEDAAEGCRQLMQLLGVPVPQPPQPPALAAIAAPDRPGKCSSMDGSTRMAANPATLHVAFSSIAMFGGVAGGSPPGPITGSAGGVGALCRTISAAATVTGAVAAEDYAPLGPTAMGAIAAAASMPKPLEAEVAGPEGCAPCNGDSPYQRSSLRYFGVAAGAACGPVGPIAAAVPPAAAY